MFPSILHDTADDLVYSTVNEIFPLDVTDKDIDLDTLAWHMDQAKGPELIGSCMRSFKEWSDQNSAHASSSTMFSSHWRHLLQKLGVEFNTQSDAKWFCRGVDFDFVSIENELAETCDAVAPWKWFNRRDSRTISKLLAPHDKPLVRDTELDPPHRAWSDATYEAKALVHCLKYLYGDTPPSEWMIL